MGLARGKKGVGLKMAYRAAPCITWNDFVPSLSTTVHFCGRMCASGGQKTDRMRQNGSELWRVC